MPSAHKHSPTDRPAAPPQGPADWRRNTQRPAPRPGPQGGGPTVTASAELAASGAAWAPAAETLTHPGAPDPAHPVRSLGDAPGRQLHTMTRSVATKRHRLGHVAEGEQELRGAPTWRQDAPAPHPGPSGARDPKSRTRTRGRHPPWTDEQCHRERRTSPRRRRALATLGVSGEALRPKPGPSAAARTEVLTHGSSCAGGLTPALGPRVLLPSRGRCLSGRSASQCPDLGAGSARSRGGGERAGLAGLARIPGACAPSAAPAGRVARLQPKLHSRRRLRAQPPPLPPAQGGGSGARMKAGGARLARDGPPQRPLSSRTPARPLPLPLAEPLTPPCGLPKEPLSSSAHPCAQTRPSQAHVLLESDPRKPPVAVPLGAGWTPSAQPGRILS